MTAAPLRRWDIVSSVLVPSGPRSLLALIAGAVILALGILVVPTLAWRRPALEAAVITLVGGFATGLASGVVYAWVRIAATARAFEAWVWQAEWELDRFSAIAGRRIGASPPAFRRYVGSTPERAEDRWIRVDILIAAGELAAAREMAERMPEETPYERVERAAALASLDWLAGGSGDATDLRRAVAEVRPADGLERRHAEVILAAHEVRLRAGAGMADPVAPLREARQRLGHLADRILLRWLARLLPGWILATVGIMAALVLWGRLGTS